MKLFDPSLYFVVDIDRLCGRSAETVVAEAVRGGVTLVQLRSKKGTTEQIATMARALVPILHRASVPLILNDSIELARAVGADGVHIGITDADPRDARERLGADAIVGWSVESLAQLREAPWEVLDYVAASPVFSTSTKSFSVEPLGLNGLRKLRRNCRVPLVAIGGIHFGNLAEVMHEGADGVAVVSAIQDADNTYFAASSLSAEIRRHLRKRPSRLLTIAGSDSGGGAGIQADLKTFQALGGYGMSVITAVTAQNTRGVGTVVALDPDFVAEQIRLVIDDIGVDAVKIGMLFSAAIVEKVADCLETIDSDRIVLDPVMVAKGGASLLAPSAIEALKARLLPRVGILTPNVPEAEALTRRKIENLLEMENAADALLKDTKRILLKGGHLLATRLASDLYADREGRKFWLDARRVETRNTHGTGCTLSSAMAAFLARGCDWPDAVRSAKAYLQGALVDSWRNDLGRGHGPVGHAWNLIRGEETR